MSSILAIALNPTVDVSCDTARIQPMHKIRTTNPRHHPGGGGVNVARVLTALGERPALAYCQGGAAGSLLHDFLKQTSIDLHSFQIAGDVRLAFSVLEETSGFEYRFVPEGPTVSEAELAHLFDFLKRSNAGYVIASGSLPLGAPVDTYARMAEIAREKGARFVLDTSGPALTEALKRGPVFLFKPSIGELQKLAGRELSEKDAIEEADRLVTSGIVEFVALTLGTKGALLVGNGICERVPAIHVAAKSAVGAGDSFVAAMVFALNQGHGIKEAFRFAVCTGAAAAMTSGTNLCNPADVEMLYLADCKTRKTLPAIKIGAS
ncbi:6-phosphofructokinase [Roseibium hamelinense]|uniref:Phosphofructokinase n=1 Tax=Roseibium hamelinense TaxID=150831 RepID=A0A562THS6_9HYPH|nr:1-phosphofructokinase family hexose kinase [Roseibium hamelinense]MTI45695.1 1-phosphofructokinase family hexose kinase [Roseibium hamelinense]TWI93122.1 6-phosphofructokinase [Roseibium hamelinense]